MTVQRDGRWYVSLEYTVAEYVRQASGWELPGPVSRTPVGFDSAEAAATGFYERLATLDVQAALDTFAPGEDAMAWIAQSWIADVQAAIERGRAEGWTVGISGLTYETIGSGDRVALKPVTFKVEGTVPQHETTTANPNVPTIVAAFDGTEFALAASRGNALDHRRAQLHRELPSRRRRQLHHGQLGWLDQSTRVPVGADGGPATVLVRARRWMHDDHQPGRWVLAVRWVQCIRYVACGDEGRRWLPDLRKQ